MSGGKGHKTIGSAWPRALTHAELQIMAGWMNDLAGQAADDSEEIMMGCGRGGAHGAQNNRVPLEVVVAGLLPESFHVLSTKLFEQPKFKPVRRADLEKMIKDSWEQAVSTFTVGRTDQSEMKGDFGQVLEDAKSTLTSKALQFVEMAFSIDKNTGRG